MIPTSPDGWAVDSGTALAVLLFAGVGTWPVCMLILALYRRAVARGMRRRSDLAATGAPPPAVPIGLVREIGLLEAESAPSSWLVDQALRGIRRAQLFFGLAAVGYGLVAVIVLHHVEAMDWLPVRSVILGLIFSWPIVPTLIALSPVGRRERWLIWAGWLALLLVLLTIGHLPIAQSLSLLASLVALPLIFMLASSARAVSGAAWLVAPALVIVGLAALELFPIVALLFDGVWVGVLALPFITRALGLLTLVPLHAWLLTRVYQAKLVSDETLLLLQWWFVATVGFASFLAPVGAYAAALAFTPYAAFLVILLIAVLVLRPRRDSAVRLLLLRTFGARRRSTRLLREVTRQWRWVGSVELITAPDLATEALDPDEFLDFIRFRLSRRFVRDQSTVGRRLAELDVRPDRDGRYRINELMCHDDTWRPAVEAMISGVDVILLDLRGFGAQNAGVVEELERLVALVPLHKVVALMDDSTDASALRGALLRASAAAPPSSPLALDSAPALRVAPNPNTRAASRQLLGALGWAAAAAR